MARKGWSNLNLLFLMIATAVIISHVVTLSLMPDHKNQQTETALHAFLSNSQKTRRKKAAKGAKSYDTSSSTMEIEHIAEEHQSAADEIGLSSKEVPAAAGEKHENEQRLSGDKIAKEGNAEISEEKEPEIKSSSQTVDTETEYNEEKVKSPTDGDQPMGEEPDINPSETADGTAVGTNTRAKASEVPGTTTSTDTMAPLSDSSWIGNDWYPPRGSKLYDGHMLKDVFKKRNILWIGDAELELSYHSLMTVLDRDSSLIEVSDLNKNKAVRPCELDKSVDFCPMLSGVRLDFHLVNCSQEFLRTEQSRVSAYDLVILGLGTWDMLGLCENSSTDKLEAISSVIQMVSKLPTPIVWTTLGWIDDTAVDLNKKILGFIAKDQNEVSHFDYGGGMRRRPDEIFDKNANKLAFSTTARMAYVQMLANHLE